MADPRLGKDGAVYLTTKTNSSDGAIIATITDWELAVNADALEKTSFGDGYDRTYAAGLRGPVATINGYYGDTDAQQADIVVNYTNTTPQTLMTVLLTVSTVGSKQGWKGRAITQMTQGAAADGIQTFSGTLQYVDGLSTYSSAS